MTHNNSQTCRWETWSKSPKAQSPCQGSKAALSQACLFAVLVNLVERESPTSSATCCDELDSHRSVKRRQGACETISRGVFVPHTTGALRCRLVGGARFPRLITCLRTCTAHSLNPDTYSTHNEPSVQAGVSLVRQSKCNITARALSQRQQTCGHTLDSVDSFSCVLGQLDSEETLEACAGRLRSEGMVSSYAAHDPFTCLLIRLRYSLN